MSLRDTITDQKIQQQQEVAEHVREYLKKGGIVQVLPPCAYKTQLLYLNEGSEDKLSHNWRLRRMVPEKPQQSSRGRLEAYKIVDGSIKSLAAEAGRKAYREVMDAGGELLAAKAARKKTERETLKQLLAEEKAKADTLCNPSGDSLKKSFLFIIKN